MIGSLTETHEFTGGAAGTTDMRITQEYASKDARDKVVASGMPQGTDACYARPDELLARGA